MSLRTRAAICTAVSVAILATGGCDDSRERSASTERDAHGTTAPATPPPCPYVEAKPTYLPWLDDGEEVPEPRRAVDNGTSYVMWTSGGDDPFEQKSLILRRDSEPLGGKGEPVSVILERARGYFYGSPGSDAAVLWKTEADACNLITLSLSLPGSSRAEVRDEILEVVESLETRDLSSHQ